VEIIEIRIPEEAATVGKEIKELSLPEEAKLLLVIRQDTKPFVPKAETTLASKDQIIAAMPPEAEDAFRAAMLGG
jgi:trk system potassium uptake protein TrkA